MTLTMPGTAVAIEARALRPAQCLHDALLAPCDGVGRIPWKALHQRPPHQEQPQVAGCSTPGTYHGAMTVPGTAVAVRPLALRLTQRRREAELWRQGRAERRLGGSSNTAPYAVLRWRCTHALRLDSHAATLTKRCGRWCYGPKTWRTPRGWEHRHRLAAPAAAGAVSLIEIV